mgnify:CR=1 FL=1
MHRNRHSGPPEKTLLLHPVGEHEWVFKFPRLTLEITEEFHEAIELWEEDDLGRAEQRYRQLLRDYPEFIDVYHHLAMLLDETGRYREAYNMWQQAVDLGLSAFPKSFSIGRDLLPWYFLDNRPFLRAYHGLGYDFLERGEIESALSIFTNILALNPSDNQGIRGLAINCNFHLKRPWEVLEISERYPCDIMADVLYGRALALYQQGRQTDAESALCEAIDFLPLVARELTKNRHRRPKKFRSDRITLGGADEAYHYWLDHGQYWKKTPGAIDFVSDCLQKHTE